MQIPVSVAYLDTINNNNNKVNLYTAPKNKKVTRRYYNCSLYFTLRPTKNFQEYLLALNDTVHSSNNAPLSY